MTTVQFAARRNDSLVFFSGALRECARCTNAPAHASYSTARFAGEPHECPYECETGRLQYHGQCAVWAEVVVRRCGGGHVLLLGGLGALLLSALAFAEFAPLVFLLGAPVALIAACTARARGRETPPADPGASLLRHAAADGGGDGGDSNVGSGVAGGGACVGRDPELPSAQRRQRAAQEEGGLLSLTDALRWDRHKYRARSHVCRVYLRGLNAPGCAWALSDLPADAAVSRRLLKDGYLCLAHELAEASAWRQHESAILALLWLLHPPSALGWRLLIRSWRYAAAKELVEVDLHSERLWRAVAAGSVQRCDGYRLELGASDDFSVGFVDFFTSVVVHTMSERPTRELELGSAQAAGSAGGMLRGALASPGRRLGASLGSLPWGVLEPRATPARLPAVFGGDEAPGPGAEADEDEDEDRSFDGPGAGGAASQARLEAGEGIGGGRLLCVVLCGGQGTFTQPFSLSTDDFLVQAVFGRRHGSAELLNRALLAVDLAMPARTLELALREVDRLVETLGVADPHARASASGSSETARGEEPESSSVLCRLVWVRWPATRDGSEHGTLALALGEGSSQAWVLPDGVCLARASPAWRGTPARRPRRSMELGARALSEGSQATTDGPAVSLIPLQLASVLPPSLPMLTPPWPCRRALLAAALWPLRRSMATYAPPPTNARLARAALALALLVDALSSLLVGGMFASLSSPALVAVLLVPPAAFACPLLCLASLLCTPRRSSGAAAAALSAAAILHSLPNAALALVLALAVPTLVPARALSVLPLCARMLCTQLLRRYCALSVAVQMST
ncbi:hypothetical protein T492DRAFT_898663 [Pavlovales sp. CCMP2436]|nr:hypothetical protein T492DRAFT_898663 [Pavlovales sp. CCMP2436]